MEKEDIFSMIKAHRIKFAIASGLIMVFAAYIHISSFAYVVKVNGQAIGITKDKQAINHQVENIKNELKDKYDKDIEISENITFERAKVSEKEITSANVIRSKLYDSLKFNMRAYALKVDGLTLAFLDSKKEADLLLDRVKNYYLGDKKKDDFKEISFLEKVEIEEGSTYINTIKDLDEVFNLVLQGENQIKKYEVKSGESTWSIAKKLDMSVADISKANPNIDVENLQVGQEINLNIAEPYIQVKTVELASLEEEIPYDTVFEETSSLYIGDNKIQKQGIAGKKKVEVEIAKINGVVKEKNTVKEEVLKEPAEMIVLKGTKSKPITLASGEFANPSRGRLSSRFGTRWGRSHTGIDIAAPKGTEIKAAASGKVSFAGTKSGYGNTVIIDHGEGIETYYTHCDIINVKVGDTVSKGQVIATVGTTGRVTGPNLHFETRKNGKPIDPLKYVRY